MYSQLQLCSVSMTATLTWPVCWLCGADPRWLAWLFWFAVWAWVVNAGFGCAVALADWLEVERAAWRPRRGAIYHGLHGVDP